MSVRTEIKVLWAMFRKPGRYAGIDWLVVGDTPPPCTVETCDKEAARFGKSVVYFVVCRRHLAYRMFIVIAVFVLFFTIMLSAWLLQLAIAEFL